MSASRCITVGGFAGWWSVRTIWAAVAVGTVMVVRILA